MQTTVPIPGLIRSLESVRQFASGEAEFYRGSEFLELHLANIQCLGQLSAERKTPYFKEKITEYPALTEAEIENYLSDKDRGRSYGRSGILYVLEMIPFITNLIRSGGKFPYEVMEKFNSINSINENIIYVLRNPGMEELIQSAKKHQDTRLPG
jgi:hypothetical protein